MGRVDEVEQVLPELIVFEDADLDFQEAAHGDASLDGARLNWSSSAYPSVGARGENLSFRSATFLYAGLGGCQALDCINRGIAWFDPSRPSV
jgi:hypothetical protein